MSLQSILSKTKKPTTGIKSTVVRVTKEFASAVLEKLNKGNRPHSSGLSKLYANEMLRGKWQTNGEPLIFGIDDEGNESLISGQHRLHALLMVHQEIEKESIGWVNAQTEIDMSIVYGVSAETADSVDTGKMRNHADVLYRHPYVDNCIPAEWNKNTNRRKAWTKALAGAARLVWLIEGGATVSSAPKFLISEMMDFLQNKHKDLHKSVTMVLNNNDGDGGFGGLKMSLPYIAALCYVACAIENEDESGFTEITLDKDMFGDTDMFLSQVASGKGYDKGSAQWALSGYWNNLDAEPGSKDRDREWVGPFVKALKAFFADETGLKVSDIKLTKKEYDNYTDFPILFDGWHELCFNRAIAAKTESSTPEVIDAPEVEEEDGFGSEPETAPEPEPEKPVKRKPRAKKAPVDVAGEDLD